MNTFETLHPVLQELLLTGLRWDCLRPVQEETYKAVSAGFDVIVQAPTAGGKTEAAFIPVIDALLKNPTEGSVRAIYLSPLKALINDQIDRVSNMCTRAHLSVAVQHGDITARERWNFTTGEQPDVLLTTPESFEVLLSDTKTEPFFRSVSFIIIDEIHAFMESDRGVHLKCLIDRLTLKGTKNPIRIGLSATVGNPEELLLWLSAENRPHKLVQIPSPQAKKQFSFVVEPDFFRQTEEITRRIKGKKALLFTDSRSFAERLMDSLKSGLENVYLHHSSVSASDREAAELSFEQEQGSCVICTSTMELGIDIGELDTVVQYDPPRSVASFLQRLGRTGRRGSPASMTFILKDPCELLITAAAIEAAMRHESESLRAPRCPYHVFVQQLFLLMKGKRALGTTTLVHSLKSLSPFAAVSPQAIAAILESLEHNGYLVREGDLYAVGGRAEAELGNSNWLTLLSVIRDCGGYLAVLPDGTPVGTLDPRFIGNEPGKVFTFTGKTWRLLHRDDVHKRALIEPSFAKKDLKRPFWTGTADGGLSPLICRSVQTLLARGKTLLPLPKTEGELLDDLIRFLPEDFEPGNLHLRIEPEQKGYSVVVSTFLGERINEVLARLIRNRLAGTHAMRTTDFAIRIFDFADRFGLGMVEEILDGLKGDSWEDVIDELPEIPASTWKFGELLPDELLVEMRAKEYYHLDDVLGFLQT